MVRSHFIDKRSLAAGLALLSAMNAGCGKVREHESDRSAGLIAAGTSVSVRVSTSISTTKSRTGDRFSATLEQPLRSEERVLAPKGAFVEGRVSEAAAGSRLKLAVQLVQLELAGRSFPIATNIIQREADGDAVVIPAESVLIFELRSPVMIP